MPSRRRAMVAGAGTVGALLAGCLSDLPGDPETASEPPTTPCSETDPPAPTDAATAHRPYPARPPELTRESVAEFLTAYERAYQYNDALAANPDKIGRTNEFTVAVQSVDVESADGRFTAEVSGQLQSDIRETGTGTTPETPTETPLPMGHGPFEAAYVVSDRALQREGVVLECW